MDEWPQQCFKAYDIRGLANGDGTGELTPKFAYRLGRAMATYLDCQTFAVGLNCCLTARVGLNKTSPKS